MSETRLKIAVYLRFCDICIYIYIHIYIYMSVCMCIAQDRAHLTQVLSCRPILCIVLRNTGCCSEHHFEESPLDRYGRRCQFSWRQPGRQQWLKPYTYSYRTQEAQLKPDCHTEGRKIGSRTTSAYSFFISSSYYTRTFLYTSSACWKYIHTFHVSLLCYYSFFKFIICCMVEMQGMCLHIVYA